MEVDRKATFLTTELVQKILQSNDDLRQWRLVDKDAVKLSTPTGLDGFMSVIHRLELTLQQQQQHTNTTGSPSPPKTLTVMVKLMKGSDDFRKKSLGFVLFPNEINVYARVIPAFEQLVRSSGARIELGTLCPRVYLAEAGVRYPAYSDQQETLLVMADVSVDGFVPGPRLNLDRAHLELMARKVAQFHACSYALRLGGRSEQLDALVRHIIPLNFMQDGRVFFESYDVVFKVAFERLFRFLDQHPERLATERVRERVGALRRKYETTPSKLMQCCLERDDTYSVILHGDYNRNNVLFRYGGADPGTPDDIMLIDFQENRYGSPALDLSFFMYMNMPPEAWASGGWDALLTVYHDELMRCLSELLQLPRTHALLEPYRFEAMKQHLRKYFIYGAVIAIKFLPCMLASEQEVQQIVHHFQTDVTADAFRQISLVAGGQAVNDRISSVIVHAAEQGYLDWLLD